jgi:hypothetical protein
MMALEYKAANDATCTMVPIPVEFVERNCNVLIVNKESTVLSIDNVCNQTSYNITVTSIQSPDITFQCYFNTTFCNQSTNSSDQITLRFFHEANTYNDCLAHRSTNIFTVKFEWILIGVVVLIIAIPGIAIFFAVIIFQYRMDNDIQAANYDPVVELRRMALDIANPRPQRPDDGYATASSDIDEDERCGICLEQLLEKSSIVMKCCNYVVHNKCVHQFLKNNSLLKWKCINPYCLNKIKIYTQLYIYDNPDKCAVCNREMDDTTTLLYTGCCQKTVHQSCYYSFNFKDSCKLCLKN